MSVFKIILIWFIVTKKLCTHQYKLFRPPLTVPLFRPKNQNFSKIKEIPDHNHMIFNSQNMMWIALQVIFGHLWLLLNFWSKKSIFFKKEKRPGYIIILHLRPKKSQSFDV